MTSATHHLNRTPLCENHRARGAKLVDFSGWEMPLQYGKVLDEHAAVRQAAGLFDISHMGLVLVDSLKNGDSGEYGKTLSYLNHLVPQDLTKLYPGKAVYTQFLNEHGGILDDIIVYRLPENLEDPVFSDFHEFLVICNAGNTPLDIDWMTSHKPASGNIRVQLVSDRFSLFALQGPHFTNILAELGYAADKLPERFHLAENRLGNLPVLLARTGYTGEDGVEIIVPRAHVTALWDLLLDTGKAHGLLPIGLAARDTLRLEAAYPLHGHDISEVDTPLEAGLGWSVKLTSENQFIGKDVLLAQKEKGLPKRLTCFKIKKKTIARQHDIILYNQQPVGEVTSGSISPLWNEAIGMGYVAGNLSLKPGDSIQVQIRGQAVDAEIVEKPFYKR